MDIGFDDVYEVSYAAEYISAYTRQYIKENQSKKPFISSACPVIIRLISMRYPSLCDNIIPIIPPMEYAAICARAKAKKEHPELKDEDIGVCFISPCPGKSSYVVNNESEEKENVDRIEAKIIVEQETQKGILIGKNGSMLKKIGTAARKELEYTADKKVFLDLQVKVIKDWRKKSKDMYKMY